MSIQEPRTDVVISPDSILVNNIGKSYTYECSTGKSIIDLTLSWNLGTKIEEWEVSRELTHSDHKAIKYSLTTDIENIPEHRAWEKADWVLFTEELKSKVITIRSTITPQRLESMVDKLCKVINNAIDLACPLQKQITINRNNPWHTGVLKQLRKQKDALYKKYIKDTDNAENKSKYY